MKAYEGDQKTISCDIVLCSVGSFSEVFLLVAGTPYRQSSKIRGRLHYRRHQSCDVASNIALITVQAFC